ncbi:MAG: hypothetical protein NXI30_18675 [bacterium]|nr:hypothetical protein [bacterium]
MRALSLLCLLLLLQAAAPAPATSDDASPFSQPSMANRVFDLYVDTATGPDAPMTPADLEARIDALQRERDDLSDRGAETTRRVSSFVGTAGLAAVITGGLVCAVMSDCTDNAAVRGLLYGGAGAAGAGGIGIYGSAAALNSHRARREEIDEEIRDLRRHRGPASQAGLGGKTRRHLRLAFRITY